MKRIITYLKNLIEERTRNPFFEEPSKPFSGTFIIIWLIHNWKIVYSVFNFDENSSLEYKVDYLEKYFDDNGWYGNLLIPLFWTFLSLMGFYLASNIATAIVSFFDFVIKPNILKWFSGKSKTVTSERHELVKRRIRILEGRISELEDNAINAENQKRSAEENYEKNKIRTELLETEYKQVINDFGGIVYNSGRNVKFILENNEQVSDNIQTVHNIVHPNWYEESLKHRQLDGAKWITHNPFLSIEEQIKGGVYLFNYNFQIGTHLDNIRSAYLYCMVDDFGKFKLNAVDLVDDNNNHEVSHHNKLHRFNIKGHLQKINDLKIEIRNASFEYKKENFENQKTPFNLAENPYGVIFSIHISLVDNLNIKGA